MKPDGSFEFVNAEPGHAKLEVYVSKGAPPRREAYSKYFAITPEMFAGAGPDQPLDLGTILLEPGSR